MLKALTQKPLWGTIGSVVVVLVLLGLWKIPQWQVAPLQKQIDALQSSAKPADPEKIALLEKSRLDAENASRTVLVQGVGGLLVFATIFISWRNLRATQEKQVADRFSKAVEQLGSENIHARLGGIYALEQIAKDAEEKYYRQVMETLTSYVRERSPWSPKAIKALSSFVQAAIDVIKSETTHNEENIPPLPIDIQAVITVLARRKYTYEHQLEPQRLNLQRVDLRRLQLLPHVQLRGVDFEEASLQKAKLQEVNLQQARLRKVDLRGASLSKADLKGAHLRFANLQGANLYETHLQNTSFLKANLQQANLGKANLHEANLLEANLQGATLHEANLQGAKLREADLQGAFLGEANLQEAHLESANLQGAHLESANLQGAHLESANLQKATLWKANLQGAKFKQTDPELIASSGTAEAIGLTWEQLNAAASYEGAILPDYLSPQPPQVETAQSAKQATAPVQAEGEAE